MNIEFFIKSTGLIVAETDGYLFVMSNKVYRDNQHSTESQEASVSFEDFIEEMPDIDWRLTKKNTD